MYFFFIHVEILHPLFGSCSEYNSLAEAEPFPRMPCSVASLHLITFTSNFEAPSPCPSTYFHISWKIAKAPVGDFHNDGGIMPIIQNTERGVRNQQCSIRQKSVSLGEGLLTHAHQKLMG